MAPFYRWGSIQDYIKPLQGDSLLFTSIFQEILGTHLIDLGRKKRVSRSFSLNHQAIAMQKLV